MWMLPGGVVALLSFSVLASAQVPTLRISGEPKCDSCRIEATRLFSVGSIPGATPGRVSHIARDSTGRYLVVVEPGPRVAVLDSLGKFLEFLDWRSKLADTPARHVTVRVDRDGRPNVYDGVSWTRFDTASPPFRVGLLDERLVMGTGPFGYPVSITRPSSKPHRSFATLHLRVDSADAGPFSPVSEVSLRPVAPSEQFEVDSVISNPSCGGCSDLVLDVAFGLQKGAVWAATADRYRLNLFYTWGKRFAQSVEVSDSWLPLRSPSAYKPGRTLPEEPRLTALVFDRNGCTYSSGLPPATPPRDTPCERYLWVSGLTFADSSAVEVHRRYSTVIDIVGVTTWISPQPYQPMMTARVVARLRLPGHLVMFGPGLAYGRGQLSDGRQSTEVYRLLVKGR